MITSCELCAKIAIEKAIREEAERIKMAQREERKKYLEKEIAKLFAEKFLAPLISELTEVPNHLFIGYIRNDEYCGIDGSLRIYKNIGPWKEELTHWGNPMKRRCFEDEIKIELDYPISLDECVTLEPKLNIVLLNQYLENFGFKIISEIQKVCTSMYSTSTPDYYWEISSLYLTAICPEENF